MQRQEKPKSKDDRATCRAEQSDIFTLMEAMAANEQGFGSWLIEHHSNRIGVNQ